LITTPPYPHPATWRRSKEIWRRYAMSDDEFLKLLDTDILQNLNIFKYLMVTRNKWLVFQPSLSKRKRQIKVWHKPFQAATWFYYSKSSRFTAANDTGVANYRPLWFWSDEDKRIYKEWRGIRYSDCYELWGFTRTGCVGCPCNSKTLQELSIAEPFEPNKVKAAFSICWQAQRYKSTAKITPQKQASIETKNHSVEITFAKKHLKYDEYPSILIIILLSLLRRFMMNGHGRRRGKLASYTRISNATKT